MVSNREGAFSMRKRRPTTELETVSGIQQLQVSGRLATPITQGPNATLNPAAVLYGIPKTVKNPRAYIAAGSAATQRNVTVTFLTNPEDGGFSRCKIWLKKYKGQNNPVLMTEAPTSPASFAVDATSETVLVIFQALGSKGEVPLSSCPTTTLTLS